MGLKLTSVRLKVKHFTNCASQVLLSENSQLSFCLLFLVSPFSPKCLSTVLTSDLEKSGGREDGELTSVEEDWGLGWYFGLNLHLSISPSQ